MAKGAFSRLFNQMVPGEGPMSQAAKAAPKLKPKKLKGAK